MLDRWWGLYQEIIIKYPVWYQKTLIFSVLGYMAKNYSKIPRVYQKCGVFFYIDPEQLLKTGFLHDFDGKKGLLGEFFDIDPIMSLYAEHQFENVADDYIACNIVKAVSLKI